MKLAISFAVALQCALLSPPLRSAPATQPAVVLPKDWTLEDHSKAGLTFSIPPTWKAGDYTEETFYYLLPTSARMSEDRVKIESHPDKDKALTDIVTEAKQKLKGDATTKIYKDAADTLDGQPAWVLLSDKVYTNTSAESAKPAPGSTAAPQKPADSSALARRLRTYDEYCVANGRLIILSFNADSATYDHEFPNFKKMMGSTQLVAVPDPSAASAAEPAPKPAAAPAAPSADHGQKTLSPDAFHFQIAIPGTWTQRIDSANQVLFELPPAAGQHVGDQFELIFGQCHEMSLKQMADQTRTAMTGAADPAKIVQDQQVTLGGRPAWLFAAETTRELHKRDKATGQVTTSKESARMYQVLTIDKDVQYILTLNAAAGTYDHDLPAVKKVIEGFKFTAPPKDPAMAATQPD